MKKKVLLPIFTSVKIYEYSTKIKKSHERHMVLLTHPDVAILVIWFPVSSSVAVEETIPGGPVRTAVATLCRNSDHLLSRAQVHLEPLVMVTVQR